MAATSKAYSRLISRLFQGVALGLLLFVLGGCQGGNPSPFVGTWDLIYGQSYPANEALSEENVASMRRLGLDAYLNLDDDGSLALVAFDGAKQGDWKVTGETTANATIEGQAATISLERDHLNLVQQGITLVFSKGDPKADSREVEEEPQQSSSSSSASASSSPSAGLSDMVVKGALLASPITIVDDARLSVIVDGVGVDRLGDPGYNVQITNNSDETLDLWVLDPFSVNGVEIPVYFFETVAPGHSLTSFMQFDTGALKSTSPGSLGEVRGRLLVDNAENETIAAYPFVMHPVER